MGESEEWWRRGVVYQVYPRSFADASGDGVGDLRGVASRLGHLSRLGVDAVWLSPVFPSPMVDFGYDVCDFTGVDPLFGSMGDFDRLVEEAHGRGIKVLLDFVPNHTSDLHPWFVESRSSRESPKRDWYLWRDGKPDGSPPNNWLSLFGGPAWTLDEGTGQYYYHAFLAEQPDLNWRNPLVREAVLDALRFWLGRGVDGFRVDALRQLVKDDRFGDNPPNPDHDPERDSPYGALLPAYSADRPEVHGFIREMRGVLAEYGEDRLLIGEVYLPVERLVAYYGGDGSGVHLPFNFNLISTPWDAREVASLIERYEAALPEGAWPNWVLGNHDRSPIASRVGAAQARVAAMLLLTLRGTPTIYYGDEIGMHDVPVPPEGVRDPWEKNVPGRGLGRNPERTPMQWSAEPNAGFCPEHATPWLPVADDHDRVNVRAQGHAPRSVLSLHRRLLALRRGLPALAAGSYRPLRVAGGGEVLAYLREHEGEKVAVALNFGGESRGVDLSGAVGGAPYEVLCSTLMDRSGGTEEGGLELRPHEGCVVLVRDRRT